MERDSVILVNENDVAEGEMEKMEAHTRGCLHRAFSIFILNARGEMLIHKRASTKYHGGGLWTNACCSHPQPGDNLLESALERLDYEMGMRCELKEMFSFIYKGEVENGLIEHEFDHVFFGYFEGLPQPNGAEVSDYQWIDVQALKRWVAQSPDAFTIWFRQALPILLDQMTLKSFS
ncbi:isopentenyl-diphosphate Delta-isomerase [Sphingobacterium paludis]|uniref:Isopentenyl-diphosphate delta-isomerase n=1 Tax=Sphingobacterium paludis TaxID=1476465 RepID=A0A4V3E2J1_9SPHI|nr:isopentenyl-diphosphate Delta-isomerase [Sphingobacterium paludis]TDS17418.1 isopentenyl-diphosphate delta-isomerase [Sphingobacterium paludis]